MTKGHVAVLMGGWSVERPVSLRSGAGVADALESQGYRVRRIDVTGEVPALLAALEPRPDVVFNALHGKGGEDGTIQALLDMLGLAYTHSGVLASALAMNKPMAKRIFTAAGLPCPEGKLVCLADIVAGDPLPRPYVIKPPDEGSSFGVHVAHPGGNHLPFDTESWPFGEMALVERFIPGRELTVAVRSRTVGEAQAIGAIEIRHRSGFFDYRAKYSDGGAEHIIPPDIHPQALSKALRLAQAAHLALGCRGISRADLRYDDTSGEPGELYLLEVNTQPGMTPVSLVPDIAAAAGISYADLVAWMVENARCG